MAKRARSPSAGDSLQHVGRRRNNEYLLKDYSSPARLIAHSIIPSFNVSHCPIDDCNDLEDYPSASFSPPRPIYISPIQCPAIDLCHMRVLTQETYTRRLLIPRTRFLSKRKSHKSVRALEKKNMYHSSLFEVAERLAANPDPFFTSNYDFYYTDGNLCILPEDDLVLHIGGEKLKNLNMSMFPKERDLTKANLRCTKSVSLNGNSEIFAVKPLRNIMGHSNCFAVRCLKNVSIFHKSEDSIEPIAQFRNVAAPFISFAQASYDPNLFTVSTMKQHVRLYDLSHSQFEVKSVWQLADGNVQSGWNTIRPWTEHTFLYANESKFYLMDTRTKADEWCSDASILSPEFSCDRISTLANSQFKNLVYIGTTHKLHCLDLRFFGDKSESKVDAVCRWSHQLDYPPAFMDTFSNGVSEYIAFGSALADDLRICELRNKFKLETVSPNKSPHKPDNHYYISPSLPYQPPTLMEAFESARSAGHCLQPNRNIKDRIMCSRTGLVFHTGCSRHEERTLLLSSNSCGDVFAMNVDTSESRSYERTNYLSDALIAKYAEKVSRIHQPKLKYTEIVYGKPLRKILCCEALNKQPDDDNVDTFNFKPNRLGRWQRSLSTLYSFKDMLAKEILNIWDIKEEDTAPLNMSRFNKDIEESNVNDYVNNWLEKAVNTSKENVSEGDERNESIPNNGTLMESLTESIVEFQENISELPQSTQNILELDISKTSMDLSATNVLALPDRAVVHQQFKPLQVTSVGAKSVSKVSKTPKKKSKHVKGF